MVNLKSATLRSTLQGAIALTLLGMAAPSWAALRIASYNVDADTDRNKDGSITEADSDGVVGSIAAVVQAMAGRTLAGNAQPLDVLSLQELYYSNPSTSITLTGVVNALNSVYGAGTYAADMAVGNTTGNLAGNGPNGLIYNTKTIRVVATKQIGTVSGSGAARAPIRYQLQATASTGANTFYLYNEHTKALSGSDNDLRRAYELDAVRADADALGSTAHVIYTGDLNLTGGSAEAAYQDITAAAGTTLSTNGNPSSSAANIVAGIARGVDPLQAGAFSTSTSAQVKYYTESDASLTARFDFQLVTPNVLASSGQAGLQLIDSTYTAFGNSYYTAAGVLASVNSSGGTINNANNSNTSVTGYTQAMLQSLLAASDHLPVLADYVIAVPEPGALTIVGIATIGLLRRQRRTI